MDVLDRIAEPARDLLGRVDAVLTEVGVPADPELRTLLTRLAGLPGAVAESVLALRPGALVEVGVALRDAAAGYDLAVASLSPAVAGSSWEGAGAAAFAARWRALAAHLGSGTDPDTMAGRLSALASYLDEVTDWMVDTRDSLAAALVTALGSAEALRLRQESGPTAGLGDGSFGPAGTPGSATAAARIGRLVLATVDASVRSGEALADRWASRLAGLAYRAEVAPETGGFAPNELRVGL